MNKPKESSEIIEVRTQLAVNRAIDRQLDRLVRAVGKRVLLLRDDTAMKKMKENQLRNVVNVATNTKSLEVVTNFIRYQVGRGVGNRNQAWLHNNFGLEVVRDIESKSGVIQELAKTVEEEVCGKIPEANRAQVAGEVRPRLTELYLAYLNRWFYYAAKTNGWQDVETATKEVGVNV